MTNKNIWYTKNNNILEKLDINKYKPYKSTKYNKKQDQIIKNRILCFNMLNSKLCSYSNKCLYAHSLEEQHIDNNKKSAIEILKINNLEDIDLIKNKELYNNLLTLTKLCTECVNSTCPGGYNCKYGACNVDILVCNNDLQKGDCKNYVENGRCINGHHLTLKNLKPYMTQQSKNNIPKNKKYIRAKRLIHTTVDINILPPTNNYYTNIYDELSSDIDEDIAIN